jgi:ribonuclease P protein component
MATGSSNALLRLRRHADYGRVYNASRKQFSKQMSFFYALRPADRRSDTPGPRIGLTVGKVLGKAHERNRIKRRVRECIRRHAGMLTFPVDVILHPRRTVLEQDAQALDREVAQIFRGIQIALSKAGGASQGGCASRAEAGKPLP